MKMVRAHHQEQTMKVLVTSSQISKALAKALSGLAVKAGKTEQPDNKTWMSVGAIPTTATSK